MKIIDLTHDIYPGMPVYPGTEPPIIEPANQIDTDGFIEHKITFYSHTGTHVDAPAHILKNFPTLDKLPIETFVGTACTIDLTGVKAGGLIQVKDLQPHAERIRASEFVIFRTGWDRYWGSEQYFDSFPVLSEEAAQWLAAFPLKGLGMDTISADHNGTTTFPIHKTLLNRSMIIIENLTRLEALDGLMFTFSCLPLKTRSADGSPVRAVAMLGL